METMGIGSSSATLVVKQQQQQTTLEQPKVDSIFQHPFRRRYMGFGNVGRSNSRLCVVFAHSCIHECLPITPCMLGVLLSHQLLRFIMSFQRLTMEEYCFILCNDGILN